MHLSLRPRSLLVVVMAVVLGLGATACSGDRAPGPSPKPEAPAASQPPLTAGTPHESEVPSTWDEQPDGQLPKADAQLSDAEVIGVLRTRSSSAAGAESCAPDDVSARLSGFDMALGHRYTSLLVENTSGTACTLDGVPGVGVRGVWGNRFTIVAEPGSSVSGSTPAPVRLGPGESARSLVEWAGDLAGAEAEKASVLVLQLAPGQVPVTVPARIEDVPAGSEHLDIGMFTTVRPGPFEPVA